MFAALSTPALGLTAAAAPRRRRVGCSSSAASVVAPVASSAAQVNVNVGERVRRAATSGVLAAALVRPDTRCDEVSRYVI